MASGDIADNGVGGADLADNSVGAGELSDNSVGSGEVTDDSLTATDITGSSLDAEVGPDFFARVQANGTVQPDVAGFPPQAKGLVRREHRQGRGRSGHGHVLLRPPDEAVECHGVARQRRCAAADRNLSRASRSTAART